MDFDKSNLRHWNKFGVLVMWNQILYSGITMGKVWRF